MAARGLLDRVVRRHGGIATTTLDLSPYLPRLALQWLAEQPEQPFLEVDGTVAFVDISGFTKLSERLARLGKMGAEELTGAIGGCFREFPFVGWRWDLRDFRPRR